VVGDSASWGRRIESTLLVLGVVLFVVLLQQIGAGTVWSNLLLIGWGLVPAIGQEFFAYVANALGWRAAFPCGRPNVPFRTLLAARIAGDAINNLTPTATMGGEVIRARMLRGLVDPTQAWASVAIAKITQAIGQVVFIIGGLVLVLRDTALPVGIERGLLIFISLLAISLGLAIITQRRGFFSSLTRVMQRLRIPVSVDRLHRLRQLDEQISSFYQSPGDAFRSVFYFTAGWTMGVVEIYLLLLFLDLDATLWRALTIEILSTSIDAALFFVPAKAGTQEGGKVLIFTLLGLPADKGLALGIARRLREVTWAFVGLAIFVHYRRAQVEV
jgi:putative membrane protein